MRAIAHQSLNVDYVRYAVAWTRFMYFARWKKQLKTFDGATSAVGVNTVHHNMRGMWDLAVRRSNRTILPATAIQGLGPDSKVLSIGPRTEGELLNLVAHGFRPDNIRGLDLISYSPWVDLGDMHAMPYEDSSFDLVISNCVIGYSDRRELAAQEMVRVVRNGGVVSVSVDWDPRPTQEMEKVVGYKTPNQVRTTSAKDLLDHFGPHVDTVYFTHDVPAHRRNEIGTITATFSVKK